MANKWNPYEETSASAVTEGEHLCVVEDAVWQTAKSSGNRMLTVTFRIIAGDCHRLRLWERFVLTEKALFRLAGLLRAKRVGQDGYDLDGQEGREALRMDVLGQQPLVATVELEEDEVASSGTRPRTREFRAPHPDRMAAALRAVLDYEEWAKRRGINRLRGDDVRTGEKPADLNEVSATSLDDDVPF